mmetsp:Transcript_7402/g.23697  ORF Transcript_7402/g.23697 Transcript_7402/m.23697 type:complete len:232 (+) Transcript_7402:1786-2481(+)
MSVSKRSPTIMISFSSPQKPCRRSMSMAWPTMYRPPSFGPPPLPHTRCRLRPSGYMSFLNMAENIPGPGSGKPSLVGLKASSAVQTNSAPCDSMYDAFWITWNDQSACPRWPVLGSTEAVMDPSEKSTTNTVGCSRWAAAMTDHSLASSSDRCVRISQLEMRSAALAAPLPSLPQPLPPQPLPTPPSPRSGAPDLFRPMPGLTSTPLWPPPELRGLLIQPPWPTSQLHPPS